MHSVNLVRSHSPANPAPLRHINPYPPQLYWQYQHFQHLLATTYYHTCSHHNITAPSSPAFHLHLPTMAELSLRLSTDQPLSQLRHPNHPLASLTSPPCFLFPFNWRSDPYDGCGQTNQLPLLSISMEISEKGRETFPDEVDPVSPSPVFSTSINGESSWSLLLFGSPLY